MRSLVRLCLALAPAPAACSGPEPPVDLGRSPTGAEVPRDSGTFPVAAAGGVDAAEPQGAPTVDPLRCHALCASVDFAQCSAAPPHVDCVARCERGIARCPAVVLPLLDCAESGLVFECDADGNVMTRACAAAFEAFDRCTAEP